jgi:hypothetical protein
VSRSVDALGETGDDHDACSTKRPGGGGGQLEPRERSLARTDD